MSRLYPSRTVHSIYYARGSQAPGKTGFKEEYSFTVFTPYALAEQAIGLLDEALRYATEPGFLENEGVQFGEEDNRRVAPEARTEPYWYAVFRYLLIRNGVLVEDIELGRYNLRPRFGPKARTVPIGERMVEALRDIFSAIEPR